MSTHNCTKVLDLDFPRKATERQKPLVAATTCFDLHMNIAPTQLQLCDKKNRHNFSEEEVWAEEKPYFFMKIGCLCSQGTKVQSNWIFFPQNGKTAVGLKLTKSSEFLFFFLTFTLSFSFFSFESFTLPTTYKSFVYKKSAVMDMSEYKHYSLQLLYRLV